MLTNKIFCLFSALLLISSVSVIIVKEPIHSLIFLLLSFICTSILLLILECEFLALLFILVYVGAIGVLFLFTIMMLDLKTKPTSQNYIKYAPISMVFIFTVLFPLLHIINTNEFFTRSIFVLLKDNPWVYNYKKSFARGYALVNSHKGVYSSLKRDPLNLNIYRDWSALVDSANDVDVYGQILYSYFVIQFLITGFILLLTVIGVVYLTNSFEKQTLQQSQFKQLSRKSKIF